jgi:transposase
MDDQDQADRIKAVHLLRSGQAPQAVAEELGRSLAWTYKWWARYRQEGWAGVKAQSRAPKRLRAGLTESAQMTLDETLALMRLMDGMRENWGFRYPGE